MRGDRRQTAGRRTHRHAQAGTPHDRNWRAGSVPPTSWPTAADAVAAVRELTGVGRRGAGVCGHRTNPCRPPLSVCRAGAMVGNVSAARCRDPAVPSSAATSESTAAGAGARIPAHVADRRPDGTINPARCSTSRPTCPASPRPTPRWMTGAPSNPWCEWVLTPLSGLPLAEVGGEHVIPHPRARRRSSRPDPMR